MGTTPEGNMQEPRRIWWPRPRKLCTLERPGGGGRSHRPERREAELRWLQAKGVRLVVSTMATRHNLDAYERAGVPWHHVPLRSPEDGPGVLEEVLTFLGEELRGAGAAALHGNRHTDFVAAVGAAYAYDARGISPELSLERAQAAGLSVTPWACSLVGVDYDEVQPRSRIAASTSAGRSVTT
jgi:hypothetical protein